MKPRRRGHRRRSHIDREVELNITAFMNLMVVLIPFLLTTAVFSRMAVLAIDVPTPAPPSEQATPPPPPTDEIPFRLVVRLEASGLMVAAGREKLLVIPRDPDGMYDTGALRQILANIKAARPTHTTIDLLSRPDTPYAELVSVMDANTATSTGNPLFEDVRIGEISGTSTGATAP
ncbi:MAG: ExbD/TolR family protein [Leptospirillia bacterium]